MSRASPTTAACPGFAYTPKTSAEVVQRLVEAGAIVIGKTNLDQFATGLVGVRSPYGVPRNPFNADYIPGGSSSGSAVAVSSGLVSFSLGTDTAGSGRVPAGFNNIVGLKPTPGRSAPRARCRPAPRSTASRSSRCPAPMPPPCSRSLRRAAGDAADRARASASACRSASSSSSATTAYAALYAQAIEQPEGHGRHAGRRSTTRPFAMPPSFSTAAPGSPSARPRSAPSSRSADDERRRLAGDARRSSWAAASTAPSMPSKASTSSAELKRQAAAEMADIDFLALPTAGTIYTWPISSASRCSTTAHLGHYTNFVNFFGLRALALPFGFRPDGLPFGITLVAPAERRPRRCSRSARSWQRAVPLPLGKTTSKLPPPESRSRRHVEDRVSIAVVGAHMSGLPLNERAHRARRPAWKRAPRPRRSIASTPARRAAASARAWCAWPTGGAAIELEVWSLPTATFGAFVAPDPGTARHRHGRRWQTARRVLGFLCESYATEDAHDITALGGWRAYLKSRRARPAATPGWPASTAKRVAVAMPRLADRARR